MLFSFLASWFVSFIELTIIYNYSIYLLFYLSPLWAEFNGDGLSLLHMVSDGADGAA